MAAESAPEIEVSVNLHDYRAGSTPQWDLPAWRTPLGQGVFPLLLRRDDHLFPIGTAFAVSKLGLIATAKHCIDEAVKHEPGGVEETGPGQYRLQECGLNVLHYSTMGNQVRFTLWPVEHIGAAPPTDVVFGSLARFQNMEPTPLLSPRLSPGLVRAGTRTHTLGYVFADPLLGIPLSDAKSGRFDWNAFEHRLVAIESTIAAVFLRRHRVVGGPCFTIMHDTLHGQSGGPVFNESGCVCGVHSGHILEAEGSVGIASMLYPALGTDLKSTVRFGNLTISFVNPIALLMLSGAIRTDDTERLVRITEEPDGWRIEPIAPKDSLAFDDAHAHAENRPSTPIPLDLRI